LNNLGQFKNTEKLSKEVGLCYFIKNIYVYKGAQKYAVKNLPHFSEWVHRNSWFKIYWCTIWAHLHI